MPSSELLERYLSLNNALAECYKELDCAENIGKYDIAVSRYTLTAMQMIMVQNNIIMEMLGARTE